MITQYEPLNGKRVAILVAEGFDQDQLTETRQALEEAGAETLIVAPAEGHVCGRQEREWAEKFEVDVPLEMARAGDYHALLLPGGVIGADQLREYSQALQLVNQFFAEGKPVGVLGHGAWILIDAGLVKGRRMTSARSIKIDLSNAGAKWFDQEVVVENGLVSSRGQNDVPAFNQEFIEQIREGVHRLQTVGAHS